jgi:hypothetical protein
MRYPTTSATVVGIILAFSIGIHAGETNSNPTTITANVPGIANPWLAGAPDGTIAGGNYDVAPNQSPVEIVGISAGAVLTFSVTGGAAHGPFVLQGPEGEEAAVMNRISGPENGIGDLIAPADALVGVFLADDVSTNSPLPVTLDFSTASARDFWTLTPALRQPFFIGDGKTSDGAVQQFIAPTGAKRLFLGTMDAYSWADNQGSFTVKIVAAPGAD